MLRYYFKSTLRYFIFNKGYSFINILGLSIGIAVFILLMLFIRDELSFDHFNKYSSRIFRVVSDVQFGNTEIKAPLTPGALATTLTSKIPGIQTTTRLYRTTVKISNGKDYFLEKNFIYTDSTFFKLFSISLLKGEPNEVLVRPYTVVLTMEMANKYFGDYTPIGKTIFINNEPYEITGICENMPHNSHFNFDFLASLHTLARWIDNWAVNSFYTYLLIKEGHNVTEIENILPEIIKRHIAPIYEEAFNKPFKNIIESGGHYKFFLQPITKIHLYSDLDHELQPNSSIKYVILLSNLALLILLTACINYVNLATARASRRSLEVGLRKTLGAYPSQIRLQFLTESITISIISVIFAIFLTEISLPTINNLIGKELQIQHIGYTTFIIGIIGIILLIGLISGIYPAFFLSSFQAINTLKKHLFKGNKGKKFRDILVVLQFSISIILIVGTLVIHKQMKYILEKDLGYDPSKIIVLKNTRALKGQWEAFKQEILKIPEVINASAASTLPGRSIYEALFRPEGELIGVDNAHTMWMLEADTNFCSTLAIKILKGRNYKNPLELLINEAAVNSVGYLNPIGNRLNFLAGKQYLTIVGVFQDIYIESLHRTIKPTVIRPLITYPNFFLIRIKIDEVEKIIPIIKNKWQNIVPDEVFDYSFLNKDIESLYNNDKKLMYISSYFTLLSIFIACLGLFGLAAFNSEQRTREIGIRKVLGATPTNILLLLFRNFIKLIVIAITIAVPLSWYIMSNWLENFAYRIEIHWSIFILAGAITIIISFVTASYQSVKAALQNPINSLKYE